MMWVLIVCIIVLVVDYFIAKKFEYIANEKGYEGYFWWCFWVGLFGYLMVVALPDRKQIKEDTEHKKTEELPDL
jgi:uncharacterized membrane protein YkvI